MSDLQIALQGMDLAPFVDQLMEGMQAKVPTLPDPTELFDQIMGGINPELTSAGMAKTAKQREKETPQEKSVRQARERQSFALYEERFREYASSLNETVRQFEHAALRTSESLSINADAATLEQIDTNISA